MIYDNIKNFKRGWFIGNFEPSVLKTDKFEVALMHHMPGEYIAPHYQKVAIEYNIMVSGKMLVNGEEVGPGDIFVYDVFEVAEVEVLEETFVVCVKTPSLPDDKVLV